MEKNFNKYVLVDEVCRGSVVTPQMIKQLIQAGVLPFIYDGKEFLVNPEDVQKELNRIFGLEEPEKKSRKKKEAETALDSPSAGGIG